MRQEHEIEFQSDSDDEDEDPDGGFDPGVTRAGTQYSLSGIELAALTVQDNYNEGTCKLGIEEARLAELQVHDHAMKQEEFILFSLTKEEKIYTSVERAFGYKTKDHEFMLVAATLADETGEIFLVGATGHNYGNTAELNVMNYKSMTMLWSKRSSSYSV